MTHSRSHSFVRSARCRGIGALAVIAFAAQPASANDWPAVSALFRTLIEAGDFEKANDLANSVLPWPGDANRAPGGRPLGVAERDPGRARFDLLRTRLLMYTRYGGDIDGRIAEAAEVADVTGDPILLADLAATRAKAAAVRRDDATAFAQYDAAISRYTRASAADECANVIAEALRLAVDREPAKVDRYADAGRSLLKLQPDTLRLRAALAAAATDPRDALPQWISVADTANRDVDRGLAADAWLHIAMLYDTAGQPADALVAARRGLFAAQQADAPAFRFRLDWLIARLQHGRADDDHAIDSYFRAVRGLSTVRHDLLTYLAKSGATGTFRERIGPVYYQLADLLFRRSQTRANAADQQNDLRLARQVVEQLKSSELEDYFQDPCVNLAKEQEQIVDRDLEHTAVVYFIPLADRTEILVTTPSGRIERIVSPATDIELSKAARQFRYDATNRRNANYRKSGKQLYDWLIAPIEPVLTAAGGGPIDTLVFVPDGDLRTVPMAALYDGKRFLVEKYAVAVSPGLSLMRPVPLDRTGKAVRVLTAGMTGERTVGKVTFAALPNVGNELERINSLYPGTVLKDKDFTNRPFEQSLQDNAFTIVHIASHGQFKPDARDTFLLTFDSTLDLNTLEMLMLPSKYRRQPIELLTLSACQTATGDDGARAALGMAGIAVKAGARSAMATLWFVSDEAAGELVGQFYQNLRNDPRTSRAEALRQGQLHVLATDRFRHPYYWAPFLMIGNWK